ncbi:MAG: thioredoxin [Candidatus Saccharibacteria bacterium]|nr:thioredoxin [Candidatus Saccharibacteria bacterium]
MKIIEGTKGNFAKEVLKNKKPVLVDFNAEWCPPCQALHPILEELAEERDDFQIVTVDIDDNEELAEEYQISSIPCLIAFKDGEEIDRRIGLQPKKRLIKMLEK